MKITFFEALKGLDTKKDHLIATVVSGPETGERVILSKGKYVCFGADGLLEDHIQYLQTLEGIGMTTINDQEIYYEQLQGRPKVVICGGGHVGLAFARLCSLLKYETTVIEDRPYFADEARKTGADHVICDDFTHALETLEGDPQTCFVVMTRGHRYDMDCLRQVLKKPRAYAGLMASRSRTGTIRKTLLDEGYPEDDVMQIYMPVGLKIGSETPEEIAVSAASQIIKILSERKKKVQMPREIMKTVLESEPGSRYILATIIRRTGSGPRDAGTKMLVGMDGLAAGTVGGGCSEAEVIQIARQMLHTGQRFRRHVIDLRPVSIDEEEGMACGGRIDVFLEVIE